MPALRFATHPDEFGFGLFWDSSLRAVVLRAGFLAIALGGDTLRSYW